MGLKTHGKAKCVPIIAERMRGRDHKFLVGDVI